MKRIFPVLFCVLFQAVSLGYCAESAQNPDIDSEIVVLETNEILTQEINVEQNFEEGKTLKERLKDVYNLEVEKYDKPSYLMEEILTHEYPQDSKLESTKFWGAYNAGIGMNFNEDGGINNHYSTNALNIGWDGKFKNDAADFRIMTSFSPRSHKNFFSTLFSDLYVATNKVPHHRFIIGHTRPPVGKEGGNSAYTIPFFNRAQIARNFGTARRVGARAVGDYNFVDYDLGLYSSDTFFREFVPGAEFVGWINVKPFAKNESKYGSLKIGTGIDVGHRNGDYCVTGAYIGYKNKKFTADFEWANANGYNGYYGYSPNKKASGFYTTLGYMLTKKLQILARYDEFDPDRHIKHNNKREYTLGLNYFIKGQALRLILNYVFCENNAGKNSHRIILGTQILL